MVAERRSWCPRHRRRPGNKGASPWETRAHGRNFT